MSKKIFTVKISELQINTYVRKEINQDHALMLALLLENKVKLPPIQVTSALIVIDGRHRIEAHQINNLAEIEVELVDIRDENELIAAAYRANMGGSLPPTPQDTEHTVRTLLDRGMPKKDIPDSLGLPVNMVRSSEGAFSKPWCMSSSTCTLPSVTHWPSCCAPCARRSR